MTDRPFSNFSDADLLVVRRRFKAQARAWQAEFDREDDTAKCFVMAPSLERMEALVDAVAYEDQCRAEVWRLPLQIPPSVKNFDKGCITDVRPLYLEHRY